MKVAVIGGGILGIALSKGLAGKGHAVTLFEAGEELGGLCGSRDYGPFQWDRFYHCILPQDRTLLRWIEDLGLEGRIRWRRTGQGYWAGGTCHPMNGIGDYLRFPLLGLGGKFRLAWSVFRARLLRSPEGLHDLSARDWLVSTCGKAVYEVFWKPLLQAKFGPFADEVAAVFLWATMRRLFGARSRTDHRERLGYVSGGYAGVLRRAERDLERVSVRILKGAEVLELHEERRVSSSRRETSRPSCRVRFRGTGGIETGEEVFEHAIFTGPTPLARRIARGKLEESVRSFERNHPSGTTMLGVVNLSLVLRRRLTPFYILNLGAQDSGLTGVIELTNLLDPEEETAGLHLVHLPRYLPEEDPFFDLEDGEVFSLMFEKGIRRLFPSLERKAVVAWAVDRARRVQPLPLAGSRPGSPETSLSWKPPFQILNPSLLECATLHNDEVLRLADRFLEAGPKNGIFPPFPPTSP